MSSIPTGLSRVPNLLLSRSALSSITRSSIGLYGVQQQLATGQRISRPGEDPVAAATLSVLDSRLERSIQIVKNLEHASSSLSSLDVALGEASDLVLEARQIALEQVNSTYTDAERDAQATVVDSLLKQLFTLGNRSGVQGYLFGGTSPGTAPRLRVLRRLSLQRRRWRPHHRPSPGLDRPTHHRKRRRHRLHLRPNLRFP
jgi:flagellar hook-associated protein 3 FlgL